MLNRRTLLRRVAAGTVTALAGLPVAASAASPQAAPAGVPVTSAASRVGTALVLSGGGARGAYEAGVIEGLVRAAGVADGEPLPGIDTVVGTSIGAINGWFVATAQYSKLRAAWYTIAGTDLFRPKRSYRKLDVPSAGVATRLMEGLALLANLNRSLGGILDAEPIKAWLRANIDPERPVLVPYAFNAADIRNQRSAYFYVINATLGPAAADPVLRALAGISGMVALAQPARPILHDALYASIALPLLLDPIELVVAGVPGLFVDGGSADNTAIDLARVVTRRINAVLVNPPTTAFMPPNAIAAGLGSFNLLQARVLDASLRSAAEATTLKRMFDGSPVTAAQRAYLDGVYDVDLGILRPAVELPSGIGDFHDAAALDASYRAGIADAAQGWADYESPR
jgi:predicted acylesterase/phospholipase RssA